MAIRKYAVPEDLVPDWLPAVPSDAAALIRAASLMVEDTALLEEYDIDSDGYPTEPHVITALRDATCAQVTAWSKAGIDPDAGVAGQKQIVSSQSVPGGSVSYQTTLTPAQIQAAIDYPALATLRVLSAASLLTNRPSVL